MAAPVVTTIETGRYRWHAVARTLTEDAGIDGLEADLRALDSDLGSVVLDLRLSGTLSLAARKDLEDRIANRLGAAFCGLRLDQVGLVLAPTEADMDDIDRAGFVRVAADRLRVLAEDRSDPERARTAAQALRRLYLEHLRQAAQP